MDDAEDLLTRTEQYRILEEPPPPSAYPYDYLGSENELPVQLRALHATSTVDELPVHIADYYASTGRPPSRRAEATSALSAPPTTNTDLDGANPTLGLPRARARMIVDRNGVRRLYPDEEETNLVRTGLDSTARNQPARRRNGYGAAERQTLTTATNRRYTAAPSSRHRPRPSPYAPLSSNVPPNHNSSPFRQAQRSAASRLSLTQPDQTTSTTSPAPPTSPRLPQEDKFTVTMDCSDASEDDEEPSSADTLADLYRRDRTLFMNHSLDMEDESDDADETSTNLARVLRDHPTTLGAMRGLRRRELPSRVQIVDLADLDEEEEEEEQDGGHGSQYRSERRRTEKDRKGLLVPHARFFIEKDKSKVSITFEPEV